MSGLWIAFTPDISLAETVCEMDLEKAPNIKWIVPV